MTKYNRHIAAIALSGMLLSSCAPIDKKNTYNESAVGHDAVVMYGKIKSSRPVDIKGTNTGAGMTVGALGGGAAGSAIGQGRGNVTAIIAGAIIGGIVGAAAEQSMKDQQGIEYIIRLSETGDTRSIVQAIAKTDTPIPVGQCVMIQVSGEYQRVLPDSDPEDCPAPPKRKKQHVKTKLHDGSATTVIEHDE